MAVWGQSANDVRVSVGALLRIRRDDRYVLFHSSNRPGSWGPPGGVFKYFEPAAGLLERLGFQEDRIHALADLMRCDLRGFLPKRSLRGFFEWFDTGAYREDSTDCLRREFQEELAEVGLSHLAPITVHMSFKHVRTVIEGPAKLPDRPYQQMRHLEIHDLIVAGSTAARVREELFEAATDASLAEVVCASAAEIMHGRCGSALLGGQSGYLVGEERAGQELPPLR